MATSVSSERAFSQGGMTISKRRNRLKGDLVEALQTLKCAIRQDLLFDDPDPSFASEEDVDCDDDDRGAGADVAADETAESAPLPGHIEPSPWDDVLDEADDIYEDEVDAADVDVE